MNRTEATAAARNFIKTYVATNRQWNISSVEAFLPYGYELRNVEVEDFFPATVKNIASVIKNHAVRA